MFLLNDRGIRIRIHTSDGIRIQEAQIHVDPVDSDPQHCWWLILRTLRCSCWAATTVTSYLEICGGWTWTSSSGTGYRLRHFREHCFHLSVLFFVGVSTCSLVHDMLSTGRHYPGQNEFIQFYKFILAFLLLTFQQRKRLLHLKSVLWNRNDLLRFRFHNTG